MRLLWSLAVALLALPASADVVQIFMEAYVERQGLQPPDCYAVEVSVSGTGLTSVCFGPDGGSVHCLDEDEPDDWNFDSVCFVSEAELDAEFPLNLHDYTFTFNSGADSVTFQWSSVGLPACFADITNPPHLSTTPTTTPLMSWTLGCSADCYFLRLLNETTDTVVAGDNVCPAAGGTFDPGVLTEGHTYEFSVGPTNFAPVAAPMTMNEDMFSLFDFKGKTTYSKFIVPEPSIGTQIPFVIATLVMLRRARRTRTPSR